MQDDIRIAIIERSIALLGPVHNGELLDPPDLETRSSSCLVPSVLLISRMFVNPFLDLQEESVKSRRPSKRSQTSIKTGPLA